MPSQRRGIQVPVSPNPLFYFSDRVYDEGMREKFLKTVPLSLVEKLDSRLLLRVLADFRKGDFNARLPVDSTGVAGKVYDAINEIIDLNSRLTRELGRISEVVGKEGKIRYRASLPGATGGWADCVDSVNSLVGDLIQPITDISRVIGGVAKGDLSQRMEHEVEGRPLTGEFLRTARTVNTMVDQLSTFTSEVIRVAREVGTEGKLGGQAKVKGVSGAWKDLTDNVNFMAANLTNQVRAIADVATAVTKGDLSRSITVDAAGEVAALKDNINEMIRNLRETTKRNTEQDWLKINLARFTRLLQGQRDLLAVSKLVLSELAPLASVQHGVFYINDAAEGEPDLRLLASYAFNTRKRMVTRIGAGEGLVGQAAFEKRRILLSEVPPDYIEISSALGGAPPVNIIVLPVLFEGQVKAVLELASFHQFSDIHITFFDQLTEIIGIMLNTITATMRTEESLKQSQSLAAELQARQTQLTETNAQLQQQARTLQESEERLRAQQEELQQSNEELQEKARLLFDQNKEVERKNREIEKARASLEEKAAQLALTSKYKSEFLANMSHELRTPLNSLLILSRLLADNEEGNLSAKQVEYAQTIHGAGDDLLQLINEILDLSRIESGTMEIESRRVLISDVREFVQKNFEPVANAKGLAFAVDVRRSVPKAIFTDQQRLQQVLKNLLANAFKFTARGKVNLRIEIAAGGWTPGHKILDQADQVFAFSVIDTGIGIPGDKHRIIFEAFQQADGTITRKYGGTGLGLSISREIAHLLGGEITVKSAPGEGSTFTLYLPRRSPLPLGEGRRGKSAPGEGDKSDVAIEPSPVASSLEASPYQARASRRPLPEGEAMADDDRDNIEEGDLILLIVNPEGQSAEHFLSLAHEHGFKGVIAARPDHSVALAREFKPHGVVLVPDKEGWIALDRLKRDFGTRHIPVQIIGDKKDRQRALSAGAFGFVERGSSDEALSNGLESIKRFLDRDVKNLLVVQDDASQRNAILDLVGNSDVETVAVGSGEEAIRELRTAHFDCMVVDFALPDMSGFDLLERLKIELGLYDLPIIVYTARELTPREETRLRRLSESIIIKNAQSPERLLAETSLFLHRASAKLPPEKRKMLEEEQKVDPALNGKKVLVIDDDVRNIFCLTSLLEGQYMEVLFAENGREGIELLKHTPDIDAILVDVMMPELDCYETMREIRKMRGFKSTPIIALTAKAMKADREKCMEAGATDYVSKPADVDRLLSLLKVHLERGEKSRE